MMAINHAVGGAIIGASITNPVLALPLAFLSHFVLDAIPHYDPAAESKADRINSKKFFRVQILLNGFLCFLLVLALAIDQPRHWGTIAICAFLGASPDLFWIPRYLTVKRTGQDAELTNPFLRFHSAIQWWTAPYLLWFELIWLTGGTMLLLTIV